MSIKILEIAVNSYPSAKEAFEGGADRIELFSGYFDGGLTPSYSLVKKIAEDFSYPIMVMIRAREGDFNYSDEEIEIMINDILLFKKLNIFGFVFGILDNENKVDKQKNTLLLEAAYPFPCTFHRAFDFTIDPLEALQDCIALGFTRILSSGQESNCIEGIDLLNELKIAAKGKIIILPGAGVNSKNIIELAEKTGAKEFHATAKKLMGIGMGLGIKKELGKILEFTQSDAEEIKRIKENLNN